MQPVQSEKCPYSDPPYEGITDDHIFPQFLGGRKTIRVCKHCNNTFGHTFEGRASKQLKRLQVFISHFGLDLTKTAAIWPAALVIGDDTYDLTSGPEGVQYSLNKPTIIKDAEGRIVAGKARSLSEANRIFKNLERSGQARQVDIFKNDDLPVDNIVPTTPLSFDDDLYRLATKMAASVLVAFNYRALIATSEVPKYLFGKGTLPSSPAYCDVSPILGMRPPLSHAIYVELGQISYAIVLIFGYMKVFVPFPPAPVCEAFLGFLDPIEASEEFSKVEPVGPRTVPRYMQQEEMSAHFREMNATLTREAILRGAKKPPSLENVELDLGPPSAFSWSDGTERFLFPRRPK